MNTEVQDWKEEIGITFSKKKIYRLEYLNKTLENHIKIYTDYLKKFDNISVSTGKGETKYGFSYDASSITFKHKAYLPFIILIGYAPASDSNEIILMVKYTDKLKFRELMKSGSREDDVANHKLSEEVVTGDEIFDEQFIYWKLNDLVKKWLKMAEPQD